MTQQPKLLWDSGSAYDFFVSLRVVHEPDRWGLRGAWAAGVRSRLSAETRDFFKEAEGVLFPPLHWINKLPAPKDAQTALDVLAKTPVDQRLKQLIFPIYTNHDRHPEVTTIMDRVTARGAWTDADVKALHQREKKKGVKKKHIERSLHWWINEEEFGNRVLNALQNYFEVFFAEEEIRLLPYLASAQTRAQALAAKLSLNELIETLSSGVRYDEEHVFHHKKLTLTPSFWMTPFLLIGEDGSGDGLFVYGARPDDASIVPGEVVPDALHQTLKALADPTRLKILKYLSAEPHTPTELAQKLRLRPPTVIHHLQSLRLAQLVYVTLYDEGKRYAARTEAIQTTLKSLENFLNTD